MDRKLMNLQIGKFGSGDELSHSLNLGCGVPSISASIIFSKVGIHESMRWQLARNTHSPFCTPSSIMRTAVGAC